jgi:hypothetical protein
MNRPLPTTDFRPLNDHITGLEIKDMAKIKPGREPGVWDCQVETPVAQ